VQELRRIRAVKLVTKDCEGVFLKELTESDRTLFKSLGAPIPQKILKT
jgi:hypothetical protein